MTSNEDSRDELAKLDNVLQKLFYDKVLKKFKYNSPPAVHPFPAKMAPEIVAIELISAELKAEIVEWANAYFVEKTKQLDAEYEDELRARDNRLALSVLEELVHWLRHDYKTSGQFGRDAKGENPAAYVRISVLNQIADMQAKYQDRGDVKNV